MFASEKNIVSEVILLKRINITTNVYYIQNKKNQNITILTESSGNWEYCEKVC